jgi:uncharacterized membrane protein (DUF485 family)
MGVDDFSCTGHLSDLAKQGWVGFVSGGNHKIDLSGRVGAGWHKPLCFAWQIKSLSTILAAYALYVGVAAYGTPQEWLQTTMLLGKAIGFGCCFGVACEVSTTRTTCLHVETLGVWMWRNVESASESIC